MPKKGKCQVQETSESGIPDLAEVRITTCTLQAQSSEETEGFCLVTVIPLKWYWSRFVAGTLNTLLKIIDHTLYIILAQLFVPLGALRIFFNNLIVETCYTISEYRLLCTGRAGHIPAKTTQEGGHTIANQGRTVPRRVVDKTRVNDQIRTIKSKEIRVVADEGQIGIMDIDSALKLAEERDLDLVEISPEAEPPVCKIMDYRKFKFEQGKQQRKAKKQQTTLTLKEIRMRPMIDTHDYEFKKRNARKFLDHGDKVKVTIRFRGREFTRQDLGATVLNRLALELGDIAKVESPPKMDGRQMVMILRAS